MERPTLGGILRAAFAGYACGHGLTLDQHKAARALIACRTEVLGGYDEECPEGDYAARRYYSCRHRSCPQCNGALNERWLERIKECLLSCAHYHVIFTLRSMKCGITTANGSVSIFFGMRPRVCGNCCAIRGIWARRWG